MELRRAGLGIIAFAALIWGAPAAAGGPIIRAGQGTGLLHVGAAEAQVASKLGRPTHAFYGHVYVYRMADGTRVTYRTARDRIVSINFAGSPGARYKTDRGGRFGMSQEEIVARYGLPDTQIGPNFFYNRLGIGFYFRDDRMSEVWVYPQQSVTDAIARR